MFRKAMWVAAMGGLLCAQMALATAADKTAQQEKMTACNKEAGDKKLQGDERKKFMSECLKGGAKSEAEAKPATQQDKMKSCNKEAGDKKLQGDERKKFMSECLKGDASAGADTKAASQPAKEAAPQKK